MSRLHLEPANRCSYYGSMTKPPKKPRRNSDAVDRVDVDAVKRRFREVDDALKKMTDDDPRAAIRAARALTPDDLLIQDNVDALAAGTLIDAGAVAKDKDAVDQGVEIFERLAVKHPSHGGDYSLANGLVEQAELAAVGKSQADWYIATADARRRARYLYQGVVANEKLPGSLRAQASTNLANSLLRVYRLVEAYDWYVRAIEIDSTNGVALTGAAKALIWLAERSIGDKQALLSTAAKYLAAARENPERIRELAGKQAFEQISGLLNTDLPVGQPLDLTGATDYQRFIARHRLALAPEIDGLDMVLSRWDSLKIGSVTTPIDSGSGVPPIFAMFNTMKSDYLCARYLAFAAFEEPLPESGTYSDTLDYALYGVPQSMMTLAQRSCLDLLDKVAVATSDYLSLPGDPSHIYFSNRWFEKPNEGEDALRWKLEIAGAFESGIKAIMAMSDVSRDIKSGGFLQEKRTMRNSSTHRFAVLHDLGCTPSQVSRYIDHFGLDTFSQQMIETLQLSRAVLFYFVEMIMQGEHRHHGDGRPHVHLPVPDHGWVRGEQ